jgi:hypothetical protein
MIASSEDSTMDARSASFSSGFREKLTSCLSGLPGWEIDCIIFDPASSV